MQYYIDETIHFDKRKGEYIPVSITLHEEYKEVPSWYRVYIDRILPKGTPVFIVSHIKHSGTNCDVKFFTVEKDARRYIAGLSKAIETSEKVDKVDVHYGKGIKNLHKLLAKIPVNTFVNFRTPTDEFSVTFARTVY